MAIIDQRRLHPRLTETDLDSTPFVPELSPIIDPHGGTLVTRPWLDWARRLTLLVGVKSSGGGGGESDPTHVVGPPSATVDAVAVYDGTTGKLIKDSLKTIAQLITDAVNQTVAVILPGGKLPVANLSVHHVTHEVGGSDQLVNAAWTNQANVFTQNQFISLASAPTLWFSETSQPANLKQFKIVNTGQFLFLQSSDDAGTSAVTALRLARDGSVLAPNSLSTTSTAGNVACKDQQNAFTLPQALNHANPSLIYKDTLTPANARQWALWTSSQLFNLDATDDAGAVQVRVLSANRSGDIFSSRYHYEQGRTVAMGNWAVIPFSAANFGASGGTWTVTSGQVLYAAYTLVGKTATISVYIAGATIGGTPAFLTMQMPAGLAAVSFQANAVPYSVGGIDGCGMVQITPGGTLLNFYRNAIGTLAWVAGTLYMPVSFTFQIA